MQYINRWFFKLFSTYHERKFSNYSTKFVIYLYMCVCADGNLSWLSFGLRSISDICVWSPSQFTPELCVWVWGSRFGSLNFTATVSISTSHSSTSQNSKTWTARFSFSFLNGGMSPSANSKHKNSKWILFHYSLGYGYPYMLLCNLTILPCLC